MCCFPASNCDQHFSADPSIGQLHPHATHQNMIHLAGVDDTGIAGFGVPDPLLHIGHTLIEIIADPILTAAASVELCQRQARAILHH